MKQIRQRPEISPIQKILNIWAVILFIWSIYRYTFKTDLPIWFDEYIAKPFIFYLPLYWFISTERKGKSLLSELALHKKLVGKEVFFGLAIGFIIIFGAVGVHTIKYSGAPIFSSLSVNSATIIWFFAMICAGISEQILSTGFVLNQLLKESKRYIWSICVSAILFFFLHIPTIFSTQKISGAVLFQVLLLNIVLSLLTSVIFVMRKNLIAPIIVHVVYLLALPILF